MTTFKVRSVSGPVYGQYVEHRANDLRDLAVQLGAHVVNSCPGWAWAQAHEGVTSFEIVWTPGGRWDANPVNRQPANT